MALLAEISIPAAELYVLRFCVTASKFGVPIAHRRYRPLLEFAEVPWRPRKKGDHDHLLLDRAPLTEITGAHFTMLQANAAGFGQLFVWFPPRTHPSGDECRLFVRAGVSLNFAAQRIGVYNRGVSKYNG